MLAAFAEAWPSVPQHHVRCNASGRALLAAIVAADADEPATKKQKSKL